MARLAESMAQLEKLEFSTASNILHHNAGEIGYTYYGIYETAHPKWSGWTRVYGQIKKSNYNLPGASRVLSKNSNLRAMVYSFYRKEYWSYLKLDFIKSQKIADELFIFSVNTNPRKAIKKAQKIVGAKVDGWIGKETIKALNAYDSKKFDIEFDLAEITFYKYLAFSSKRKAHYVKFYNGWVNRARAV